MDGSAPERSSAGASLVVAPGSVLVLQADGPRAIPTGRGSRDWHALIEDANATVARAYDQGMLDLVDLEVLAFVSRHPGCRADELSSIVRPVDPSASVEAVVDRLCDIGALWMADAAVHRVVGPPSTPWARRLENRTRATLSVTATGDARYRAVVPRTFTATADGFSFAGRTGEEVAVLSGAEVVALAAFVGGSTVEQVRTGLEEAGVPITAVDLLGLVDRAAATGLLVPDGETPDREDWGPNSLSQLGAKRNAFVELVTAIDGSCAREEQEQPGRRSKPPVVPIIRGMGTTPPSALGLLFAHAMAHDGGRLRDRYDFQARWVIRTRTLRRLLRERPPGVYLFSNYVWSMQENMQLSALVKELSPASITVHGGPSTPRYPADTEAFLRAHPHVDIATRNEGELTLTEVLDVLDGNIDGAGRRPPELRDVAGIAFLDGDEHVRTPDRDRVADLDELPSPFLTGLFDDYDDGRADFVVLESNRGCPYGCTFCDWGSATLSRIRKFSLDRVFAELEWAARRQTRCIALADANFGIMARDVEIAEKVAELRRTYGYPESFYTSKAKNTVRHLRQILAILNDAGVTTDSVLALQTTDETTLQVIRRSNIKTETYHQLAMEYRATGMSLSTDLIVGLPGSTPDAFATDLQVAADREIYVRTSLLELLPNSPMNDPEYRQQYQITSDVIPGDDYRRFVTGSASHSFDDLEHMWELARFFHVAENTGVLRYLARWVRQETGTDELELYRAMGAAASARPAEYPLLLWAYRHMVLQGLPPLSWAHLYDEVARFLHDELGLPDSSALRTVLTVQFTLAPDRRRTFPEAVELEHDYAAWFHAVLAAKEEHPEDWPAHVAPLSSFGPATFTVDDPAGVCERVVGTSSYYDHASGRWELESPIGLDRSQLGRGAG